MKLSEIKDVKYDLFSLAFNKHRFFRVNFLINFAFEHLMGRYLFYFSFPKCGVYKRAAFKKGNTVYDQNIWGGGGGGRGKSERCLKWGDGVIKVSFQKHLKSCSRRRRRYRWCHQPFPPPPSTPMKKDRTLSVTALIFYRKCY